MTEEEKIEQERLAEEKRLADEDEKNKIIIELKEKLDQAIDPKEHAKLKADYKKAMDDFVNRRPAPVKKEIKLRPAKEIAKELASIQGGGITNRDYVAKSLEYRKSHIKEFGTDPFSDFGQNGPGMETDDTREVASVLQTLLDENESPVDFRIKLNSVLADDLTLISKLRKRK